MKVLLVCFVFVLLLSEAAFGDKEDKSSEEPVVEEREPKLQSDNSSSVDDGPPDSHEAMNNRPLKPKITSSVREKRSYEFLIGLLNNRSGLEVTNTETGNKLQKEASDENIRASEVLLELLVKIAAHPSQWEQVHDLLQKIDTDLTTSKHLYKNLNSNDQKTDQRAQLRQEVEQILKQQRNHLTATPRSVEEELAVARRTKNDEDVVRTNNTDKQLQKMVVILNGHNNQDKSNKSRTPEALKANKWPDFDSEKSGKGFPRNFAYHRVTGKPFNTNNKSKNPKAYIAVSVIAPKPMAKSEDVSLENELKELKPWTHKQNLRNMAAIRSRWLIQSDDDNDEDEKKGRNL